MAANTAHTQNGRMRPLSLGGFGILIASIALSVVSYAPLADTIRIRWAIGTYQHYGPEHVSMLPVLLAFPVVLTVLYVGARWFKIHLERTDAIDGFDEFRAIYNVCVLLALGTIVGIQVVIIVLNL